MKVSSTLRFGMLAASLIAVFCLASTAGAALPVLLSTAPSAGATGVDALLAALGRTRRLRAHRLPGVGA